MKHPSFRNITILLALCILATVAGVIAIFAGYRRAVNDAGELVSAVKEGAGMAISCVRQTAVRDGVTEWCLDAASAEYINAESRAVFTTPSVTFFENGREKIVMTAASGTVRTDSNDIRMSGGVVVKDQDYVLKTETLSYDNQERRFFTDVPVAMSGAGFELTADSASLDMKTRRAVLNGNVRGVLSEDVEL